MSCERLDRLIHLFLDGRLDQDQERELQEHLSKCERCAKRLALFQKIEGTAKRIPAKEPSQEYWNSFSSRLRAKITAREQESPGFGLKKALESIFAYSPLKIKVAAGLVSIVLVFIIGKLYIDYKGQEIVPSQVTVQPEQPPPLEIKDMEEEALPAAGTKERAQPIPEKPEVQKERVVPVFESEKVKEVQETARGKADVLTKKGEPAPEPEAGEEMPSVGIPAPPERLVEQAEELPKAQLETAKAEPVGAGVEEKAKDKESRDIMAPREEAAKVVGIPEPAEVEEPKPRQFVVRDLRASVRAVAPAEQYLAREMTIPRIEEDDTLMRAEDLAQAIQVWKAYIEKNPEDSLTKEGYLQVATAYYLLAKLTADTTRISEGSKTIEEYIQQVKDREIKDELNDRLRKIEALKQR
ncbi:MAG: hypothetical protein GTO24_20900 [candidate division Zixibacteria bacterium]|nr:hypothetical protein [candidate division Zixibacteria bacterium]